MTNITTFEELAGYFFDLYGKAEYAQALDLLTQESARFPAHAASILCWRATMLARLEDPDGAVELFEEALAAGYWYHEGALRGDPDYASLQETPQFQDVIARCAERRKLALAEAKPSLTLVEPRGPSEARPLLLALHGNFSNAVSSADYWASAAEKGWLVALPQSSELAWASGYYNWNDIEHATAEIQQHYAALADQAMFDPSQVIIAGFSMGAYLAQRIAVGGSIPVRGFIAVEGWVSEEEMPAWQAVVQANRGRAVRGYLIAGKQNAEYQEITRKNIDLLRANGIACELEEASNTYHAFAPEFDQSLSRALDFICND